MNFQERWERATNNKPPLNRFLDALIHAILRHSPSVTQFLHEIYLQLNAPSSDEELRDNLSTISPAVEIPTNTSQWLRFPQPMTGIRAADAKDVLSTIEYVSKSQARPNAQNVSRVEKNASISPRNQRDKILHRMSPLRTLLTFFQQHQIQVWPLLLIPFLNPRQKRREADQGRRPFAPPNTETKRVALSPAW